MRNILTDSQAKGESTESRTPNGLGEGENQEPPGRVWRKSEGQELFKAGVNAIIAGSIIHREAITTNMKPGLPEIAHIGRFRVVERLAPTTRKHANTNRDTLAAYSARQTLIHSYTLSD